MAYDKFYNLHIQQKQSSLRQTLLYITYIAIRLSEMEKLLLGSQKMHRHQLQQIVMVVHNKLKLMMMQIEIKNLLIYLP